MARRLCDVTVSAAALVLLAPLMVGIAVAIRATSPGPVIVGLSRVGRHGVVFTMHKFRTMNVDQGPNPSPLTRPGDPRVFPFGAVLRRLKMDELPQLYDVLRGAMSLVGPRPEDPRYLRHYRQCDRELLAMRPGLTSPATLYDYTHGEAILATGDDPDRVYVQTLLPVKLALDHKYLRTRGFSQDLRVIGRTVALVVAVALGKRTFAEPLEAAGGLLPQQMEAMPCQ